MTWVTKPVYDDDYLIFIGPDYEDYTVPSTYTPGVHFDVGVAVLNYNKRYRGLMIYAKDDDGNKVGNWTGLNEAEYSPDFQHADICKGSILHAGAVVKDYVARFKLFVPEGTGRITLEALIKYGAANTGDFYWPRDVVLEEGNTVTVDSSSSEWDITALGQSCREYCESKSTEEVSYYCVSSALDYEISEEYLLDGSLDHQHSCKLPYISTCSTGASYSEDGLCYYQEEEESCISENRTYEEPSCTYKSEDPRIGYRFCTCSTNEEDDIDGSANGLKLSFTVLLFSLLLSFRNKSTSVLLIVCVTLYLSQGASAHNWVNSPSRIGFASTHKPCLSGTGKPHVQIGPGQNFIVEWMVGHFERLSYFTLLHADNAEKMKDHKFNLLDDYLANAPANSNKAKEPGMRRFHRKSKDTSENNPDWDEHFTYVPEGSNSYVARPAEFTQRAHLQHQYDFLDSHLNDDIRVEYENENYPWIISMSRFPHSYESGGEFDSALFSIPEGSPFGRYVLHYMWAGYYDCIDIDYIDQQVEHIYGLVDDSLPVTFTRIDHCYFHHVILSGIYNPLNPYQVLINNEDPVNCIESCRTRTSLECKHVQVIPLHTPPTVNHRFVDESGILQTAFYEPYNRTLATLKEQYSEDTMVCYDLTPNPKFITETQGEYIISLDPTDPAFYSTCYIADDKKVFIGYNSTGSRAKINTPWRFGSKCISCEDHAKINADDYLPPHWKIADKCVNCDLEPVEKEFRAKEIHYSIVRNDSYCDGFRSRSNDTYSQAHHKTCEDTTYNCVRHLNNISPDINNRITLKTCAAAVLADEECSSIFFRSGGPNSITDCYCYSKKECCHGCSPNGVRTGWNIYEVAEHVDDVVADPECDGGTLSFDGTACCSDTCGYGQCRSRTGVSENYGFCCSTCLRRSCKDYPAPCYMEE
eukprot:TRINITY_DN9799_c0_g1_i1.p1 TRINITY_DN9799_c0_g1~~TRINITY_DN9799_c0_g1_i1.p1  ORF type:complete len:1003 (-),score=253.07 TRINITY_DN9799_c0_g1_i1:99-2867(-)